MSKRSHLTAVLLLSCATAQAAVISVSPQQMQRLGIRTETVRAASSRPAISVLGRVTPAPDSRIPVSAPFAGSVQSLIRLEGETVKKGDALAVIASSDAATALGRLQGQEAQYRSAKAAADRARALVSEGIAPQSRAEEAIAAEQAAAAELAAGRSATARASRAPDGGYHLTAPQGGRIASVEAHVGDQLAAMQPLMTIDTRTELWIEGALPAAAVGRVAPGDQVLVDGMPGVTGTVMAAGASIDPRTRAATLRARMANPGALVGGQTVRLTVLRRATPGSLNVPRAALVELANGPVVFVVRNGGFEPVPVRVTARGPADATVSGALSVGDRIAISGLSELKAASAQE
jgi:cobalt-zinc-cadmium efflux system membrane fusion protein